MADTKKKRVAGISPAVMEFKFSRPTKSYIVLCGFNPCLGKVSRSWIAIERYEFFKAEAHSNLD